MPDIDLVQMGYGNSGAAASRIPEEVKRQLLAAQLLQKAAQDQQPIYNPALGWGKVAAAGLGGILEGLTEKKEAQAQKDYLKTLSDAGGASVAANGAPSSSGGGLGGMIAALFGGGQKSDAPTEAASAPAEGPAPPQAYAAVLDPASKAISSIESGGRYDALGPVIEKTGDRAYGKYQVMGANVPQWTKAHLGQEMTPEQFLADPKAQEAVFKGQFGQYAQKYGPEGAARAWFAGEGGMNNPNARDPLGTTVASYASKFTAAGGAGQPQTAPQEPQAAPQQVAQVQPAQPSVDVARRTQALKAVIENPRATPQERMWAQQQLQPDYDMRQGADGTIFGFDKRNPSAPPKIFGKVPIEQFRQGTRPDGTPIQESTTSGKQEAAPRTDRYETVTGPGNLTMQRNVNTGKLEASPQPDENQRRLDLISREWKTLGFPDPKSTDPKDVQFYRELNAKALGGPSTNVTVDQRGENAFAKKGGEQLAEDFAGIVKIGRGARQNVSDMQTLGVLLDKIGTGKSAEAKAIIGPYAQALGIDVKNLSEIQAAEAIIQRMAPQMRVPGSGAQSDFELRGFLQSLPSIGKTAEGNAIVQKTFQGMYDNQVKAAEIASEALAGKITPAEADRRMRELPDHMADYRNFMKASTPATTYEWQQFSPDTRIRQVR